MAVESEENLATTLTIDQIVDQVRLLSPDDQAHLIQQVAELLRQSMRLQAFRPLVFGEFAGDRMSTEEDFLIAEWHPTEKELNGA